MTKTPQKTTAHELETCARDLGPTGHKLGNKYEEPRSYSSSVGNVYMSTVLHRSAEKTVYRYSYNSPL